MTVSSSLALALAVFIFAVIPGPGVFATVSRALGSGFRSSLALIAGIINGDIIYLLFALFGLSSLAGVLGRLFFLVRLIGGFYLIWLGIRMWRASRQALLEKEDDKRQRLSGGYLDGLLVSLCNPKVILFYCGFLPAFLDFSRLGALDIIIVGAIVPTGLAAGLTLYALAARTAGALLSGESGSVWLNRIAGGVMVVVGVLVAAP